MQTTAQEFYDASYNRAKDTAKLDKAFTQFKMALRSEESGTSVMDRALVMAAKTEAEAFA